MALLSLIFVLLLCNLAPFRCTECVRETGWAMHDEVSSILASCLLLFKVHRHYSAHLFVKWEGAVLMEGSPVINRGHSIFPTFFKFSGCANYCSSTKTPGLSAEPNCRGRSLDPTVFKLGEMCPKKGIKCWCNSSMNAA